MNLKYLLLVVAGAALLAGCAKPQDKEAAVATPPMNAAARLAAAEDAVPENPLKDVFFGETHMHTLYSLDAYIGGNRMTPDDSLRFARGEEMVMNGQKHSIGRPLDFAAVTDHAEYIGEMYSTYVAGAPGHENAQLVELRGLTKFADQEAWFLKYVVSNNRSGDAKHPPFFAGEDTIRSAWQIMIDTTQKHYEPGKFTTIPAFEWTAAPNGGNMHRNILFRDANVLPDLPFSGIDSPDEEALWTWIEQQRARGSVLFAIPHNSNASKGQMFEPVDNSGKPIDKAYAERRSGIERLIELMQIKGNSEVNRKLWPADEFADFENADSIADYSGRTLAKENYVRNAVIKGLDYQAKFGANPYMLGFNGGTDNHNGGMADVAEDNWIGGHGPADGTVERRRTADVGGWIKGKDENPGSITGVWATKNTRGAIYDAMYAREVFVTSGPRIKVRLFAGAGLAGNPVDAKALVSDGYANGVPMGGVLASLPGAPTLTVYAEKDSIGANLDRIQIIKGWVDAKGENQERIVDVVWSGDRRKDAKGKLPAVGNTVDLETAAYTNSIGATVLMGSWTDDSFDPQQNALYYARVLEIPTPRWSTYDAVRNNLPLLADVPATIQERAWTSPVWYQPQ